MLGLIYVFYVMLHFVTITPLTLVGLAVLLCSVSLMYFLTTVYI